MEVRMPDNFALRDRVDSIKPVVNFPTETTSSRRRMGVWKNGWFLLAAGWGSAALITAMDFYGLPDALREAWKVIGGG